MIFTVELDIPLPPRKGKPPGGARTEFPFEDMSVGSSFYAGCNMAAQTACVQHAKLFPPKKFTTRFMERDPTAGKPGLRVWRIR